METPDNEKLEVEWIVDEDFGDDGWEERWFVETQGPRVYAEADQLKVRLIDDNRQEAGVTVWWKEELSENIVIDVQASTDAVVENNACNLNFFIHARESDGSALRFGREGIYKEYHELPNHLITFTGGITPGWSRARLNPGFNLIHESPNQRAEPGQEYRFLIIINGDRVRYYINGEKIHDYHVDDALPGGWFALRTWFSSVNYESVRIGEILDSKL
ncbi:DUF6250 domain-containing protein [Cerasicoccus frondis]|uniref:DUF6250 domain-containing protein n=1 Tax=Cerasicoccus frondis TaxID=490090 RepID=UPI0028528A80|nr:DUF6250 domain-containing protein [Cerasicoccus frondis]